MLKDEVLHKLRQSHSELEAMGVRTLHLFGSVARGQESEASDVDLLVEFSEGVGLFELTRLRRRIEAIVGRRVDLVPAGGLKPRVREEILRDCVRAA